MRTRDGIVISTDDAEGDIDQNARKWYEQTDPSVLATFWPSTQAAIDYVYSVSTARTGGGHGSEQVRQKKWDELVAVTLALEKRYGWGARDGREAYTKDEAPSHKSRVLGMLLLASP